MSKKISLGKKIKQRKIRSNHKELLTKFLKKKSVTGNQIDKIFSLLPDYMPELVTHKISSRKERELMKFEEFINSDKPLTQIRMFVTNKANGSPDYKFEERVILKILDIMVSEYRQNQEYYEEKDLKYFEWYDSQDKKIPVDKPKIFRNTPSSLKYLYFLDCHDDVKVHTKIAWLRAHLSINVFPDLDESGIDLLTYDILDHKFEMPEAQTDKAKISYFKFYKPIRKSVKGVRGIH